MEPGRAVVRRGSLAGRASPCITSSPVAGRVRECGGSPLASKKLSCSAVRLPAGGMAAGGGGGSVGGLEALAMKG